MTVDLRQQLQPGPRRPCRRKIDAVLFAVAKFIVHFLGIYDDLDIAISVGIFCLQSSIDCAIRQMSKSLQ